MSTGSNTSEDATQASTSTFVTSLVVNTIIAGVELVAFIVLRRLIKALYEPRTYIPPKNKQAAVLGKNLLYPLWRIIMSDPGEILEKNGVDPYVFVRFLIMMSKAMVPIWLVSWIVLLPVDSANTGNTGKDGLDRLTFGNVPLNKQDRLWAHLILDYLFIGWIIFLIWGEMQHWLVIRQKHLINPAHSKLPQANTVLVTGISKGYMDEEKLAQLFTHLPGGVKRIWLNRNLKEMPNLWERRSKAAAALESAQVKLIKSARQHRIETEAKIAKLQKKNKTVPETLTGPVNPQLLEDKAEGDNTENGRAELLGLADQLVPRGKRPMTRLKPSWAPFGLGFLGVGEKVDTIDWARKEIQEIEPQLEASRNQLQKDVNTVGIGEETYPPLNSAFVHFNQQIAAHMAAQCLTHNQPYRMNRRYIEQSPANVIWRNLSLNPYEQNVRQALSYAATVGLILAWTFPVSFIGILSSVTSLTDQFHWLRWIQGDSFGKSLLQGVITGILPPVLLALLMLLLPFVLRQLAAFEGIPSKTEVELSVMTRYFIFLVIHTFLVVTLSHGLISAVPQLAENPASIATVLATQMPTASTFFITLVLTQFTGTAGNLLQPISLVLYYLRVILGGGTPRSVFKSRYRLGTTSWGTQFPQVTVYAVIMIGYCVISPIINGFGACFFILSALVFKYLFIWVQDQPAQMDTGGMFFPKAITHVFVGIYIQEICLCALFFLARDENHKVAALPQAILEIVLIVCTAAVHYVLLKSYGPLTHSLPLSLAHLSYGMPMETGHEGSIIGQYSEDRDPMPINSSTEHLTKKQPSPPTTPPRQPEKPVPDGVEAVDFANTDRPRIDTPIREDGGSLNLDFGLTSSTSPTSPTTTAIDTVPGPPVKPTHPENGENGGNGENGSPVEPEVMELGTMGQDPDPSNEDQEEAYFAVPGGPGLRPEEEQEAESDDPYAFFHPATKEPLRILWLPKDELGLCEAEIEKNTTYGIEGTHKYATLNSKGRIQIAGPPPDRF